MLAAIIPIGGAGVVAAELTYGTLDVGYSSDVTAVDCPGARGLLLAWPASWSTGSSAIAWKPSAWMAWVCIAILTFLGLAYSPAKHVREAYARLGSC